MVLDSSLAALDEVCCSILVSHFRPIATGHGGEHRTYQIASDVEIVCGSGNVVHLGPVALRHPKRDSRLSPSSRVARLWSRCVRRFSAAFSVRKVSRSQGGDHFGSLLEPVSSEWVEQLKRLVAKCGPEAVVFVEHPGLLRAVKACVGNAKVIAVMHNLETLDALSLCGKDADFYSMLCNSGFSEELSSLAMADERLAISDVEAGLLNTLGLQTTSYPYRPVGEIRSRCLAIRDRRRPQPGNLVLLGSAGHGTTREGMLWLLRAIQQHGLPKRCHLTVVGGATDTLIMKEIGRVENVSCVGWATEDLLTELLVSAEGVVAPQFRGMGLLTKLSELSLSGVPLLTGSHALLAGDPPPGVVGLPQDWNPWEAGLADLPGTVAPATMCDYLAWEARLNNPFAEYGCLHSMLSENVR